MGRQIAAVGLRIVLAAIIYLGVAVTWISKEGGWKGLELFAQTIIFGIVATLCLVVAMMIGRQISDPTWRLLAHVPITLLLFLLLGYVVVGVFMGMRNNPGTEMGTFAVLVGAVAVTDSVAGHWLDRWASRHTGQAR